MCGEKTGCPGSLGSRIGSPPHVRRKGLPGPVMRITGGITPACAGKSFLRSSSQSRSGDHPRVCGEKVYKDIKHVAAVGSPPRMRGKGLGASKGCDGVGITPACAGKSASHGCGSRGWRDHPRVCGEKANGAESGQNKAGSPPRMRGKASS